MPSAEQKYSPDQPRVPAGSPDGGQWAPAGAELSGETRERISHALDAIKPVVKAMGFPIHQIDIRHEPMREFKVGDRTFHEGGHFNPETGRIMLNAQTSASEVGLQAMAAHEISHHAWHTVRQEYDREHEEIRALFDKTESVTSDDGLRVSHGNSEADRFWNPRTGFLRPEARVEAERRWPVSATLARYYGDAYLTTADEAAGESKFDILRRDDGTSQYSAAYWSDEAMREPGSIQRAVNETLAEVTRQQLIPRATQPGDRTPSRLWQNFAIEIRQHARRLTKGKH